MSKHLMDLRNVNKEIYSGHLKLGGRNPKGDVLSLTNYYMEKNGSPYFGIVGEFHFTRYEYRYWEEEIIKIKMSGINTIATYVFWNHIEQQDGVFNWSGNNNLSYFVDLCAKHDLYLILRIGPFCHGEVRNGGLPDWLYGRSFEVRSNDEGYLFCAGRWYKEIGRQVDGRLFKDGGPIIGVQLENEYMAATSKWECTTLQGDEWINQGSGGVEHMKNLKRLAIDAGFEVPLYTCTGWGSAPVIDGEMLPMLGGYAYCPWIVYWNPEAEFHPPTYNYIFYDCHRDNIQDGDVSYQISKYPYACCELGGGMQTWYNYRFIVPPESVEAMIVNRVAGGCNFVGYYMYHGGSNPIVNNTYMNERTVPKISYDFLTVLGEYGQIRDSYRYIKPLHYFLKDFEDILCPMATALPEGAEKILPEDTETLRFAARVKDNSGFLFLTNFQDHVEMKTIEDIQISLKLSDEELVIPANSKIKLMEGVSAIFPFNLDMEGIRLKYSTTQLVTRINHKDEDYYIFFEPKGIESEYCFHNSSIEEIRVAKGIVNKEEGLIYAATSAGSDSIITLRSDQNKTINIITLTREEVLGLWKVDLWGNKRIIISDSNVLVDKGSFKLLNTGKEVMKAKIFPPVEGGLTVSDGSTVYSKEGLFDSYEIKLPKREIDLKVFSSRAGKVHLQIEQDAFKGINDVFLRIDYAGDVGNAFIDGRLINDNFCNGDTWEIGLKRFYPEVADKGIDIYISPIREGKVIINDSNVATKHVFVGSEISEINSIEAVPEYKVNLLKNNC